MGASIAVLITYHDEKKLLSECLDSLFRSSEIPDEVLVYDDASSFPAAPYVGKWPVRVLTGKENKGQSFGRNALARETRADYVHFQDADDLFAPAWCARVRGEIAHTHTDAVFTEVSFFKKDGSRRESVMELKRLEKGKDLLRYSLEGQMLTPCGTYRLSKFFEAGGYREEARFSEDFDFHVRFAATHPSYTLILEPLIWARLHASNSSSTHDRVVPACWAALAAHCEKLKTQLTPEYHQALADAAAFAASQLYRRGLKPDARKAFDIAKKITKPSYTLRQSPHYARLASALGPETAESIGALYRALLPDALRAKIRRSG